MKEKFKSDRQMLSGTLLKEGDYNSVREMIERIARLVPDNQILAELDGNGKIRYITSRELHEEIMNLGDGLIDAGLKDAHIAIMAQNSCRYVISDITVSSGVGVVVPIDKDAENELLITLLNKCDADAVICNANIVRKLNSVRSSCGRLKTLITIDKPVEGCLFYDDILAKGASLKEKSVFRNINLDLDKPAKILFTSGTTGANKGVVLTNTNLAANVMNCLDSIRAEEYNTSMSVLPMHHATEINTHVVVRISGGRLTYINDNMRNLMTNIKIFKPTVITVVPMIANAFYKSIWANAWKAGKAEKLAKGIKLSNFLRKLGIDRTHQMFSDLYEAFGGNLNMMVCGGSMLNPMVVKGLNDLGIRTENGYGITECGPLISINGDTLSEHLSVGKPCYGLEAKLVDVDEDGIGELCVRGRSVAKCYYNDEEATRAAFAEDGFFNTGDSARIDEEGRIFLMGRKKNTIVLQNGKNICPEELENILETNLAYANEIVVYQAQYNNGFPEDVLCAGIYIEDEEKRADHTGIVNDIKAVNAQLPEYKHIDFLEIRDKEYEKTSTRKIKRSSLPSECSTDGIRIF